MPEESVDALYPVAVFVAELQRIRASKGNPCDGRQCGTRSGRKG